MPKDPRTSTIRVKPAAMARFLPLFEVGIDAGARVTAAAAMGMGGALSCVGKGWGSRGGGEGNLRKNNVNKDKGQWHAHENKVGL